MPYIVVRHSVKDYAKWKPIYDGHGATRGTARYEPVPKAMLRSAWVNDAAAGNDHTG